MSTASYDRIEHGAEVPGTSIDAALDGGGAVRNVKHVEYGAKGDGSTDDLAALKMAADDGGAVVVPPGDYFISGPLELSAPADIRFAAGARIVSTHGGDEQPIVRIVNGEGLTLRGMHLVGSGNAVVGIDARGASDSERITLPNIFNARIEGIIEDSGSTQTYGFRANWADGGLVDGLWIEEAWRGINLGRSVQATINTVRYLAMRNVRIGRAYEKGVRAAGAVECAFDDFEVNAVTSNAFYLSYAHTVGNQLSNMRFPGPFGLKLSQGTERNQINGVYQPRRGIQIEGASFNVLTNLQLGLNAGGNRGLWFQGHSQTDHECNRNFISNVVILREDDIPEWEGGAAIRFRGLKACRDNIVRNVYAEGPIVMDEAARRCMVEGFTLSVDTHNTHPGASSQGVHGIHPQ